LPHLFQTSIMYTHASSKLFCFRFSRGKQECTLGRLLTSPCRARISFLDKLILLQGLGAPNHQQCGAVAFPSTTFVVSKFPLPPEAQTECSRALATQGTGKQQLLEGSCCLVSSIWLVMLSSARVTQTLVICASAVACTTAAPWVS
jgi:hypothetical protein